jgi:iron only hydrogenase large subunit-like protein
MDENKKASIDNDKCIMCGACVYQCPFGAITDKSSVLSIVDIMKKSGGGKNYKVFALLAPAIANQFRYARPEQIVTAIKKLGFSDIAEAAFGADIVLYHELAEWEEKGILTTSCCPSFVMYIEKNFPTLKKYISSSLSPMIEAARVLKRENPGAKVIFIGPCTSKKYEYTLEKTGGAVDGVMSFEELQAYFEARGIEPESLEETPLEGASYFGRIFAASGGVAKGVAYLASVKGDGDKIKPAVLSGIEECKIALLKLRAGKSTENFFEGMACEGGCVNGALCISRSPGGAAAVERYANASNEKTIDKTVERYKKSENAKVKSSKG